ncbi:MAG: hypothetical protein ACK59M_14860 [Pseudomonadota bacterium]|jgi:hypothetical protein
MIRFGTWLPQILAYARFLADSDAVRRAWIDGDLSETSISDFDELYEQIFDDLDSKSFLEGLPTYIPSEAVAQELIRRFLSEIESIDVARANDQSLATAASLVGSHEWSRVAEIARELSVLDQQRLMALVARSAELDRQ